MELSVFVLISLSILPMQSKSIRILLYTSAPAGLVKHVAVDVLTVETEGVADAEE